MNALTSALEHLASIVHAGFRLTPGDVALAVRQVGPEHADELLRVLAAVGLVDGGNVNLAVAA